MGGAKETLQVRKFTILWRKPLKQSKMGKLFLLQREQKGLKCLTEPDVIFFVKKIKCNNQNKSKATFVFRYKTWTKSVCQVDGIIPINDILDNHEKIMSVRC